MFEFLSLEKPTKIKIKNRKEKRCKFIESREKKTVSNLLNSSAKMTSPFHELPGLRKYCDVVFEWRSLLQTPCFGFNGPNACYSSTCNHNPSLTEPEKQLVNAKLQKSSKLPFKFNVNARKSSAPRRVVDHNAYKSSLPSHLTVKMNAFSYSQKNAYDDCVYKLNG